MAPPSESRASVPPRARWREFARTNRCGRYNRYYRQTLTRNLMISPVELIMRFSRSCGDVSSWGKYGLTRNNRQGRSKRKEAGIGVTLSAVTTEGADPC